MLNRQGVLPVDRSSMNLKINNGYERLANPGWMYSRSNENEKELYFKLEVVKFYRETIIDWVACEDQIERQQGRVTHIRKKM